MRMIRPILTLLKDKDWTVEAARCSPRVCEGGRPSDAPVDGRSVSELRLKWRGGRVWDDARR